MGLGQYDMTGLSKRESERKYSWLQEMGKLIAS